MEFSLQQRGGSPEVVFHRVYERAMAATSRSPDDLVRAWTQTFEEILRELESDLASTAL